MTDDLWAQLTDIIEPRRYEIGADEDGTWDRLCADLSAVLSQHGWPDLKRLPTIHGDWSMSICDGEILSLLAGLNDRVFLALERGGEMIRERSWYT